MAEIQGFGLAGRVCLGWCVHRQLEQNAEEKRGAGSWPNVGWCDRGHQRERSDVPGTLDITTSIAQCTGQTKVVGSETENEKSS